MEGVGESLLHELESVRGNLLGKLAGLDERA